MKIKLLLLDFDGTVANTGRANATSYIEALAEEGITISMEEYRAKYFGLRCPEFLADIGITDPEQMRRIRQRKVEIYHRARDSTLEWKEKVLAGKPKV